MSRLKNFPANLGLAGHDGSSASNTFESPWRVTVHYVPVVSRQQAEPSPPDMAAKSEALATVPVPGSRDGNGAAWLLVFASIGLLLAGFLIFVARHFV